MDYRKLRNYQNWITDITIDHDLLSQIKAMSEEDLLDAFLSCLEFGTAGIRGIMGPGSNRMNIYTVRKAALAFARYLLNKDPLARTRGVVIAYDNRFLSKQFCDECVDILTGLSIKTYIFPELRPTPHLSFAVKKLNCSGGIVITASHNPKQYNGLKVYDENGCQLTPDLIAQLHPFYAEITNELTIKIARKPEYLTILDSQIDEEYYAQILETQIRTNLDCSHLRVVYSPQHGTGFSGIKYLLEYKKYDVHYVWEQCSPDPTFSKTLTPNPEEKSAYVRAIEIAKHNRAQIILTTDPDADRIGVVEMIDNQPYYFTGNQIGALLIHYIVTSKKLTSGVIYDTIVTSRLGGKIASSFGLNVESTLTGFKFIGQKIAASEQSNGLPFIFGYEESYGYLLAPFVRDKDALQAALMILEMKTYYQTKGLTLQQMLQSLFQQYGYYYEDVYSLAFHGSNSQTLLNEMVAKLRNYQPYTFGEYQIQCKEDYESGYAFDATGAKRELTLPKSNVLRYILQDGSEIAIRPSGTEPKCKLYFNLVGSSKESLQKKYEDLKAVLLKIVV